MSEVSILVTSEPEQADLDTIGKNLMAYNDVDAGPANRIPLAVLVRDLSGDLVAGISGNTAWGWLFVQWLWVAEGRRGQKLADRMLTAAENEARARGCHGAWIDTFNPVALKAYQKAGYAPFGELSDFPKGRTRTFLQKKL